MIAKPESVNIMGIVYTIAYVDNPSEVDIHKRDSLWGQIDFWTRTIRVYDNGRKPNSDIFEVILHEILHGLATHLRLKVLGNEDNHDELELIALGITDTLVRNGWVTLEASKE